MSEQERLLREIRRLTNAIIREAKKNPAPGMWTYGVSRYDARTDADTR